MFAGASFPVCLYTIYEIRRAEMEYKNIVMVGSAQIIPRTRKNNDIGKIHIGILANNHDYMRLLRHLVPRNDRRLLQEMYKSFFNFSANLPLISSIFI